MYARDSAAHSVASETNAVREEQRDPECKPGRRLCEAPGPNGGWKSREDQVAAPEAGARRGAAARRPLATIPMETPGAAGAGFS